MTDVIKLFEEHIWKPEDFTELYWFEENYDVYWNEDNNITDLIDISGQTYSGYVSEETVLDGYVLFTLSDGCGGQYQAIFDLNKKKTTEQLEEML